MKERNIINNKSINLLLVSFLLFSFLLNIIQAVPSFSEDSIENLEDKWEYLGKEWKTILLDNPFVKTIDSFLTRITVVFFVIFGINYSLSMQFLFTIILWVFFVLVFSNSFKIFSTFSQKISGILSLFLVIIFSNLGMLRPIVNFIIKLMFGQKEWWMKLIIGLGTLLIFFLIISFLKMFGKNAINKRKKLKEEMDRMKLDEGAKVAETISSAAKKVSS